MALPTEDVVFYSIIAFIVIENFIEIYLSRRQVRLMNKLLTIFRHDECIFIRHDRLSNKNLYKYYTFHW